MILSSVLGDRSCGIFPVKKWPCQSLGKVRFLRTCHPSTSKAKLPGNNYVQAWAGRRGRHDLAAPSIFYHFPDEG